MRVVAIVSDEVTYQPRVYQSLLRLRARDISAIALVPFVPPKIGTGRIARFMWDLYGPAGFLRKCTLVASQRLRDLLPAAIAGSQTSVTRVAKRHGVPVKRFRALDQQFRDWISGLAPDVILSSQGHYVPKSIRDLAPFGVLNKHAGLLPRYRGVYPVFCAMLAGEPEIGLTVHQMSDRIDAGPILHQERIPIGDSATFESLYEHVVLRTAGAFDAALRELESGAPRWRPNDDAQATEFGYPSRDDIRSFHALGHRVY